jgi:NAD(P)H-nitrite reductase large subunit
VAEEHFIVVGNGPCGHEAAVTLREWAPEARITIIGEENEPSYRPHMLPGYLAGTLKEEFLYIASYDFYKRREIKFRCGQKVVHLDPRERFVVLDHKEKIHFTGLIIAVGGTPRIPEPLSAVRDSLQTLKTLRDAKRWRDRLKEIDSVLVIGGDLTSFGFTRALLQLGKRVHFVLDEGALWPMRFNQTIFDEAKETLTEAGVDVLPSQRIRGVTRFGDNSYIVRVGERELGVGLIGAFFGLVPDVAFLLRSGLSIDRGILVDEYLQTEFEGIFAAGDCAQVYHPELHDYWVSIGHDNARTLGRVAAINLAGGLVEAETEPESILQVDGVRVNTSWWMEF